MKLNWYAMVNILAVDEAGCSYIFFLLNYNSCNVVVIPQLMSDWLCVRSLGFCFIVTHYLIFLSLLQPDLFTQGSIMCRAASGFRAVVG